MSGPVAGFKYVHEAIRRESAALVGAACALGEGADVAPLIARVEWFSHAVHLHTSGEELGLFPAVEERAPHLQALYVLDHREETERFEALLGTLRELRAPAAGDAAALRQRAVVHAGALAAHASLHSRKEDQLLVPILDRLFSVPEQGAMVGEMLSVFPPADMQRVLPWIIERVDAPDRVTYMHEMRAALPADRFQAVAGMVSAGVPPAVWEPIAAALAASA